MSASNPRHTGSRPIPKVATGKRIVSGSNSPGGKFRGTRRSGSPTGNRPIPKVAHNKVPRRS